MNNVIIKLKCLRFGEKQSLKTVELDILVAKSYYDRIKKFKPTSEILVIESEIFGLNENGEFANGGLYEYNEKFELVLKPQKKAKKVETETENLP